MGRKKINVSVNDLKKANDTCQSGNAAAKSLGLTYQTFQRRCLECGIEVKKNQSGRGLNALERYGEVIAAKMIALASSNGRTRVLNQTQRQKLRDIALARIEQGKMPSKGLKGYYEEIWFDSSWELAYYLWMVEANRIIPKRNKSIYFDYEDANGVKRRTKPDFILPSGELIEIKGYPNVHTEAKFNATKDKVRYLFREDLKEALLYTRKKYGNDFTKKFYASVVERYTR
jgi:hypothetical protein